MGKAIETVLTALGLTFGIIVGGAYAVNELTGHHSVVFRAAAEDDCSLRYGARMLVQVEGNEDGVSCFYQ